MIRAETEDGFPINIPYTFCGYKFLNIIGIGSTSIVGLIEDETTCQLFSAKIMPKRYIEEKNLNDKIQKEIAVLGEVDHPNIVKIYRTIELKNGIGESYIVLVMEYCENGDLLSYVTEKGFSCEKERMKILRGFLEAIKYLHKRGISHGDIKPENILIDSEFNPKLCDFGYCRTTMTAGNEAKSGTLYYAAPELFTKGEFNTLKTDIWAIGITLYCLSKNRFPYKNGKPKSVIKQIKSGKLYLSSTISDSLKNLVEKCTTLNPENRPSIDEILNDEYLSYNGKINEQEFVNSSSDDNQY